MHGARGEDPTEPPASAPYPFPAVSHEPRIQQLSDDLAAAGYHPFHAPCGVLLNEANMPLQRVRPLRNCDGFPCLVHAKSDAEVLGVRPALEHRNVTLLTNARSLRLETDAARPAVTGVVVDRATAPSERYPPTSSSSPAAPPTPRSCCCARPTTSTRTAWPTAPTRSAATTCSTTARPCSPCRSEENPTVFQKTLGLNDFYFGGRDFDFPMGNIQMVGKSQAPMFRGEKPGETSFAPQWSLEDVARHAVDFWLSTEDLPRPENRVTRRRATAASRSRTRRPTRSRSGGCYDKLKLDARHIGMHRDHLLPDTRT